MANASTGTGTGTTTAPDPAPPNAPGGGGGGGGGAGGDGAAAGGNPVPAITFALSPALAVQGLIDYKTKAGAKIYETATAPLPREFDCQPGSLLHFVQAVKERAIAAGWVPTLQVPSGNQTLDLTEHYGHIALDDIKAHAVTYIGNRQGTHRTLSKCSNVSVKRLPKKPRSESAQEQVDTQATVNHIRERLQSLDALMQEVDSDVTNFNVTVKHWQQQLTARGETVSDILLNLFKGYTACADSEFVDYIKRKKESYDEGAVFDADNLMDLALNKFRTLTEAGEWKQPSLERKEVIALTAKINKYEKDNKDLRKKFQKIGKGGKNGKGKDDKSSGSSSSDKSNKSKTRKYPNWKYEAPKSGEPRKKTVKSKEYFWCKHHELWTEHKEEDCKRGKQKANESNQQDGAPALQIDRQLGAIVESDGEDDSSI